MINPPSENFMDEMPPPPLGLRRDEGRRQPNSVRIDNDDYMIRENAVHYKDGIYPIENSANGPYVMIGDKYVRIPNDRGGSRRSRRRSGGSRRSIRRSVTRRSRRLKRSRR